MITAIDNLSFYVPGLGRFTLGELAWRRELIAAELYDREKPAPLPTHTEGDSLTKPLPRISKFDEVKAIYALREAAESTRSGNPVTLGQLRSIKQYTGIEDGVYDFLDIPLQLTRTIEDMGQQIEGLKLAKMPDEMDAGVNPLESEVYPFCQRYIYLNLKADTILQLIEERGGQEELVKAQRGRLDKLGKLFNAEVGSASSRLGGPDAKECLKRAMVGINLDNLW